jgi:predicted DCC family thiol-disulfide oxidoreductase YuxK
MNAAPAAQQSAQQSAHSSPRPHRPVGPLTLLYDPTCPMCRRLSDWLRHQPTLMSIELVAVDSPGAHQRFPGLDHQLTRSTLTVIDSAGALWQDDRAWLVLASVLPDWAGWAAHFATPWRRPVVRLAVKVVDQVRRANVTRAGQPDQSSGCTDQCRR